MIDSVLAKRRRRDKMQDMGERSFWAGIAAMGLLSGCIPPGVASDGGSRPSRHSDASTRRDSPRIDADLVGVIEDEPVWTQRQVTPNARDVEAATYTVLQGETLRGIGNKTGAGSEAIARVNGLTPPYLIRPGQQLEIPRGRYHRVTEGETGIAIAAAYGVKWSDMVALNALAEPFVLRNGQMLALPGGARAGSTPIRNPRSGRVAFLDIDIDDVLTGGQPAAPSTGRVPPATQSAKPLPASRPISEPGAFAGNFAWPLDGAILARFGPVASGVRNDGIDIRTSKGTPIRAAAPGVVAYAGDEIDVYGGLVLIVHGSGWVTAYGHADRIDVVRGQKIERGQIIGASGDSGHVGEPRLHFEIRKNRQPVNPLSYLPRRG